MATCMRFDGSTYSNRMAGSISKSEGARGVKKGKFSRFARSGGSVS